VARAEAAAIFSQRVASNPTEAIPLSIPTRQILARIYARDTALFIATEGLKWISGTSESFALGDPLLNSFSLAAIFAAQSGMMTDMDSAAAELVRTFSPA
jgi:hypothetical protein